ncbi:MAG TPA: glycosyl hydrolase [Bryobacteraceae bacterium]|nr:glycosyl hydrolase [Bryobacteraceae bacterium]
MSKLYFATGFALSICLINILTGHEAASSVDQLRQAFLHPPDDARIMMRWWWFGPAVAQPELDRELHAMKDAGIGGVEIQPVYPLQLDDAHAPVRTAPYLSPEFLATLQGAASTARSLDMRVDITLGSGWPYGGPHTLIGEAAGRLRVVQVNVPEGTPSVPLPAMENGETLIGAIGGEQAGKILNGRLQIPAGLSGSDLLYFFIASRTGQQVKRSAIGAEGFVLNHYSRSAIEDHLSFVGNSLLRAFDAHPPYAVFSDSLEVYGSDWTDDFLAEFRKRRGYDLTPFLPALVRDIGANTRAIRHDWGKTLTELTEENYLKPIREWAQAHHTLFRSQTYGEPPVILSSNRYVDLPEGEHGPYWRRFSAARWASSASHLYGRPVTSTETWTWLHSPAFRATPLDLKAEADRHFIEGINQLIGHGWPYSPPSEPEPGWSFYAAAAALNDHNPWFDVMPDFTAYLQRVSFLLRQGQPANDVAIYLPTDDAWARLQLGKVAVDEMTDELLGPVLIPAVLNGGYNFDFIDDRAIAAIGIPYKLLILPGIERIPLATMQRLQTYVQSGGLLIATRSLPSLGAGLLEEKSETAGINELSQQIFRSGSANTRFVAADQDVGSALKDLLPPDFATGDAAPSIGFVHRKLTGGDIYFVANAANRAVHTTASIRISGLQPEWWDPFSGKSSPAEYEMANGRTNIPLSLAPYESKVLVFATPGAKPAKASPAIHPASIIDISSDWTVTFLGTGKTVTMPHLHSWTDDEATRFYSGRALYQKTVSLLESFVQSSNIALDFGPGIPTEPGPGEALGMQALLDSPVREAAVAIINGKRAGVVWHPPYELDITAYVHPGENQLQITVGNLAINEMSGHAPPDYTLLNLRYGARFTPQDMQNLKPLPSGILRPVILRAE